MPKPAVEFAPRTRRNPRLVWAGALLVVAGLLLTLLVYASGGHKERVLVAAAPVRAGEPMGPQHLRVVEVDALPVGAAIPADRQPEVVGSRALVELDAGDVVPPSVLAAVGPANGVRRVGLKLAAGRYPTSLRTGHVRLVPHSGEADVHPQAVVATLASPVTIGPDGAANFDADVPEAQAPAVASWAVRGELVATSTTDR